MLLVSVMGTGDELWVPKEKMDSLLDIELAPLVDICVQMWSRRWKC